jgi:hypothetical protein
MGVGRAHTGAPQRYRHRAAAHARLSSPSTSNAARRGTPSPPGSARSRFPYYDAVFSIPPGSACLSATTPPNPQRYRGPKLPARWDCKASPLARHTGMHAPCPWCRTTANTYLPSGEPQPSALTRRQTRGPPPWLRLSGSGGCAVRLHMTGSQAANLSLLGRI